MGTPVPKTLAYTREDALQNLSFFFGAPQDPQKLDDFKEHHVQTYHFPDAYTGPNAKLRETMINLIVNQPQEWQTSAALPFVKIEGTNVEWDELHFDVRLMQRVPVSPNHTAAKVLQFMLTLFVVCSCAQYEGVSRMQTSLRRTHRDRVVRRGIGMVIESDFYATESGQSTSSASGPSVAWRPRERVQ